MSSRYRSRRSPSSDSYDIKFQNKKKSTIDVTVVSLTAITTIMASLTAIAMMSTLVTTKLRQFVVLPTVATFFTVSLAAITVKRVVILGGRMVVFTDITIL